MSRDEINLAIPLSFCSIIKEEEVYSYLQNDNNDYQIQQTNTLLNRTNQICNAMISNRKYEINFQDCITDNLKNLKIKFQKLKVKFLIIF